MKQFKCTLIVVILLPWQLLAQTSEDAVSLQVGLNGLNDATKTAGFLSSATINYDEGLDIPEPPLPIENYVSLAIEAMPGSPAWFTRFRSDYRSVAEDLDINIQTWPLIFESDNSGLVTLQSTIGQQIDSAYAVFITDGEEYWNLWDGVPYEFIHSAGQQRIMTLTVGTPELPAIDINHPSMDTAFIAGSHAFLEWDIIASIGITSTVVEVSLNAGQSFDTILDTDSVSTSLLWDVPILDTDEGILRVSVVDFMGRESTSEQAFAIVDESNYLTGITILSPVAGQCVTGGSDVPVVWRYEGGDENVTGANLEYQLDYGSYQLIETISGKDTSTTWIIPSEVFSAGVSVRIQAVVSGGSPAEAVESPIVIRTTQLLNDNFELWSNHGPDIGPADHWAAQSNDYGTDVLITRSNVNQVDGPYCARIEAFSSGTYMMYQEHAAILPGSEYTFSCRLYDNEDGVSALLREEFLDGTGDVLSVAESSSTTNSSDSQPCSVSWTAPQQAVGVRYSIVLNAQTSGSVYADYSKLETTIPNPSVEFTSPQGGEEFTHNGTSTFLVEWTYGSTAAIIDSVNLDVSFDDGESWNGLTTYDDNSPTSYLWIGADTYSTTVRFRLQAWNPEGASTTALSEAMKVGPSTIADTLEGNWHLWTPSLLPQDNETEAVFDGEISGSWALYTYSVDQGYMPIDSIQLGQAYWLGLSRDEVLNLRGKAEFSGWEHPLHSGWNLIGSGYPIEYSVANLALTDGVDTLGYDNAVIAGWIGPELYKYDPTSATYVALENTSTLVPSSGAWIAVLQSSIGLLAHAPTSSTSVVPAKTKANSESPFLWDNSVIATVVLQTSELKRDEISVGFARQASNGYDTRLDKPAPPRQPNPVHPRAVLVREDHDIHDMKRWKWDIRAPMTEEQPILTWNIEIQGPIPENTVLDFSELVEALPDSLASIVFVNGEEIELAELASILVGNGKSAEVQLKVGMRKYLGRGKLVSLPSYFSLDAVYPNPFNSSLTLQFSLPDVTDISIRVFNLLGQTVEARELRAVGPGRAAYQLECSSGTGIYFLRVATADGHVITRKVLLVK